MPLYPTFPGYTPDQLLPLLPRKKQLLMISMNEWIQRQYDVLHPHMVHKWSWCLLAILPFLSDSLQTDHYTHWNYCWGGWAEVLQAQLEKKKDKCSSRDAEDQSVLANHDIVVEWFRSKSGGLSIWTFSLLLWCIMVVEKAWNIFWLFLWYTQI